MAVGIGERYRATRAVAAALALGLGGGALAGCGGGSGGEKSVHDALRARPAKTAKPFEIKDHDSLPQDLIPLSPATMTVNGCFKHFWSAKDREPPASAPGAPLKIIIDGRCNTPLTSHNVGLYPQPSQEGEPEAELTNGQVVGVVCQTDGEWIQDVRGGVDGSTGWVEVVDHQGDVGDVPDVNAGFPDTAGIPNC